MITVLGSFRDESALLAAARQLRADGVTGLDLHTPYPVHGAEEALGLPRSTVPILALVAALTGAISGYLLQWYTVGFDWPLNVGNRPPHSPPAFIPVTFELGVLFSALSIFFGLLFAYFKFPRVHHPVFEAEEFRSASIDGMWVSAVVTDVDRERVAGTLRRLGALQVSVVEERGAP